jgi:hypothetical protein
MQIGFSQHQIDSSRTLSVSAARLPGNQILGAETGAPKSHIGTELPATETKMRWKIAPKPLKYLMFLRARPETHNLRECVVGSEGLEPPARRL